jgi:allophanate hydrolase
MIPASLDLKTLAAAYRKGLKPAELFTTLLRRAQEDCHHAWISLIDETRLSVLLKGLESHSSDTLPLFGVPFAIKDNIDWCALPTTAACPDFAYTPARNATVVEYLLAAGAIPLGKTNLDQFATGLNGTRSPYGACRNSINPAYISGGSSSGSAVALALGQVSFALGTDTAGSGRVPAAFNNLVGLKPTCGVLSTRGVVPACRSLDAVSIFALTAEDAAAVLAVAAAPDADDPYARPMQPHGFDFGRAPGYRLGVLPPAQRMFFGPTAESEQYRQLYVRALEQAKATGATWVDIDYAPFLAVARLLYGGPWVAERFHAIRDFITRQPESVFPVTREITLGGAQPSAVEAFDAFYQLKALKAQCDRVWQGVDAILLPTAGCHPTIQALEAQPVELNTQLGHYSNFMNLLDYSAIAVPAGFTPTGLPFGVTCFAPAHQDIPLLHWAQRWQAGLRLPLGATQANTPVTASVHPMQEAVAPGQVRVAVCGAHLSGQPLNHQLTSRAARLVAATHTAPDYRIYALAEDPSGKLPRRPGLVKVAQGGVAIEVEVWELPESLFGSFVAGIPAPLGIGKTVLSNGQSIPGFICEPDGLTGATDISEWGGWLAVRAGPH